MGKPTGFLEQNRELPSRRPVKERLRDYREVEGDVNPDLSKNQAARCMDCGTPFCHHGCPLGNNIPEFNDAVYQGNWRLAYEILISTNNFPEFTGRVCPAPCETSCVLGINKPPVTIEYIEKSVIEKAFADGLVVAEPPAVRTGKSVAVIGSGPAGLAAASQLNKAGHLVTVFERADAPGGLLRYGIPDFKLDKSVVDRRIALMEAEGIQFTTSCNVGVDYSAGKLMDTFDAILLCGGSTIARNLSIPGRQLGGIHLAMDYLSQQNRRVSGKEVEQEVIDAKGKKVLVIGGGDTGSDCVGTANRQGAASVQQFEILSKPPMTRTDTMPWPQWPVILRTSSSHEEGCDRHWSVMTKEFVDNGKGQLRAVRVVEVEWKSGASGPSEIPGSLREIECELVLLAMGFTGPQQQGLLTELGVAFDARGLVACRDYQTNVPSVFSAGDMRRGQSLVVWALHEGREAARSIDLYLSGESLLEARSGSLRRLA